MRKEFREEMDNIMDDAFTLGASNSRVASAYFLEVIARLMYFNTFHKEFVRDYERAPYDAVTEHKEEEHEVSESTDI